MSQHTQPQTGRTRSFGLLITIFIVIELTPIFETTMISIALPTLSDAFDINLADASWLITIFLLVGTGTAAIAGRLGDLYGRKRVIIVLMAISTVGSIVSVIFGNFTGVLIGRALQGTSAGIFPLLIGLSREVTTPKRVSLLSGVTSGVSVIGGALGALGAGIILDTLGWHAMFIASAILAVIAIAVALLLPSSTYTAQNTGKFDVVGAVVLAPAIASFLYGVTSSRSNGFTPTVWTFMIVGLLLLVFWVVWELRISQPMFNLRLFTQPSLVAASIATALFAIGAMAAPALLIPVLTQSPVHLPVGLGLTPTQAGVYGLIGGFLSFLLSPFAARFAGKRGARLVLLAGIGLGTIGSAFFLISMHNLPIAIVAMVVSGVGIGLVVISVPLVIMEIVRPEDTSEAVGLVYTTCRTIFNSIGTALVGVILASSVVPETTAPTLNAWNTAVWFVIVTGVIGFVATLTIKRTLPLDQREAELAEARTQKEPVSSQA